MTMNSSSLNDSIASTSASMSPSRNQRAASFAKVDHVEASGDLGDVLREWNVMLGGSTIGKGLLKAADHHFQQQQQKMSVSHLAALPGASDLTTLALPLEDPFYVVDIGVLVSQVYQWRRFFPRIEPFYAVKCNPDPIIIQTLCVLGCNFDCASQNEIKLVQDTTRHLPRTPDILYANPCKPRSHLMEAVCRGVTLVTFDNVTEVQKCAGISNKIQLILRILTDDRGSQCRLSTKFGAPPAQWRILLKAAQIHGLDVVGVSFHVGSGCRDATRYELALRDARKVFDMAKQEFGMEMNILDIGGGFPGETHSIWNPAVELDDDDDDEDDEDEGKDVNSKDSEDEEPDRFMFFQEIAKQVAPLVDEMFPSNVRVISEPGRYFVAAAATLCCSVVSARSNAYDASSFEPEAINDHEASVQLEDMTRQEEQQLIRKRAVSIGDTAESDAVLSTIHEELDLYSKLFACQQLTQHEFDVYNDDLDLFKEGFKSAADLLGPPEPNQMHIRRHTVEGMTFPLVEASGSKDEQEESCAMLTLAAAGEAAVNGVVMQAVADSAPLQDDFAYYINDGVYGAFNNIMFDHAQVRPRVLRMSADESIPKEGKSLFASTVFGPTCDSIDVIARSVLLPRLKVGDWMYFANMGAYTMAASSSFNGFTPSEKVYVCSVQPEYFDALIAGPAEESSLGEEEKKEE